ncbi:hypothetical protein RW1_050_00580 [Rhodococcus wratislaviensis NBRC 100605]|jgi:hypothetical protein|uniref:Uncharacterized protein n=1 Tax=Rhodococcus wratislaviensis NBRC 100605 TaxID=1219028 RepID=X0PXS4_RHOWR|nr:hypothetical protein RW1_050_00580 [Rhodococcus wratislaviensis NBRC 100605]
MNDSAVRPGTSSILSGVGAEWAVNPDAEATSPATNSDSAARHVQFFMLCVYPVRP